MKAEDLKKGSKIEVSIDGKNFKETTITRVSDKFVWFKESGFERVGKTTIDKYNCFYRIVSL
jgi:glucan-binding YG repeat protein